MIELKQSLIKIIPHSILLIDGSIDRLFLGHPSISDFFFFSLHITNRKEQWSKIKNFIFPKSFSNCPQQLREIINKNISTSTKSLILNKENKILYKSHLTPFTDQNLLQKLKEKQNEETSLYLNGALTISFYKRFLAFKKLNIILDNFTLCQNIPFTVSQEKKLLLFNPINLKCIFLKEDIFHSPTLLYDLKKELPVYNIYREDFDEIRI